jgi:steroid 5-alpha reductase family enzyme
MVSFDPTPFHQSTTIFTSINMLGLLISILSGGSHIHIDLLGTGAFALAALIPPFFSFPKLQQNSRIVISSLCVSVWSIKLALFLFYRALQVKTDARLDDTLNTFSGTVGFWFISTLWGIICSLPHALGSTSPYPGNVYSLIVGLTLFGLGLITETRADYQKWIFKQQWTTAGQTASFCNVGLWSISQHPNFLGNLLLWFGILVMNGPSLIEWGPLRNNNKIAFPSLIWKCRRLFIALLSPCFMFLLFHGQASGYITNSVQLALQKYGGKPNGLFEKYMKETPLIFPRNIMGWLYQALKL